MFRTVRTEYLQSLFDGYYANDQAVPEADKFPICTCNDRHVIDDFRGEFRWLSNYHVHDDGMTVETLFQAAKATNQKDHHYVLSAAHDGKMARRRGKEIKLRDDWELIKRHVMYNSLVRKFKQWDLRQKLLDTGVAYLEEGNWWHDQEWGNCTCDKHDAIPGQNMLGLLLMRVRHELLTGRI